MKTFITKATGIALLCVLFAGNTFSQNMSTSRMSARQIKSPSMLYSDKSALSEPKNAWDILYNYNYLETANGFLGTFYYDGQVFASRWNPDLEGNQMGKLYIFNIEGGTLVPAGEIIIPGITGTETSNVNIEGFCTDGTYIYAVNESFKIYKIDPTSWEVVSTMPCMVPDVASIAYDEASGGFWVASIFGDDAILLDANGMFTGISATGASGGIMGLTYDKYSEGGPYLWAACGQTPAYNMAELSRWKLSDDAYPFERNVHDITLDFPLSGEVPGHFMGSISSYVADEKYNILGISQGQNQIFAYEVGIANDWAPCPGVENLEGTIEGTDVYLTWTAPEGNVIGYVVYTGDTELATVTNTNYQVKNLTAGAHILRVKALFSDECNPVSVSKSFRIIDNYNPVQNLEAVVTDAHKVTLSWDSPKEEIFEPKAISWCSGLPSEGISAGYEYNVAVRWDKDDFATLKIPSGCVLTKISFIPYVSEETTYIIKIWQGGTSIEDPGTQIGTDLILNTADLILETWNEITLDTPITIDATQELRIGYRVVQTSEIPIGYPAGAEIGEKTAVDGKANLIDFGYGWETLGQATPGFNKYSWNISGYLTTAEGKAIRLGYVPIVVTGYNIYCNDEKIGTTDKFTFEHTLQGEGKYNFCVVAKYNNDCQSPKECKEVDTGSGINDISAMPGVTVYPNPTIGNLIISILNPSKEASGGAIRIFDVFGRIVIDNQQVAFHEKTTIINISHLPAGMYFVQIQADNKWITKKIVKQ